MKPYYEDDLVTLYHGDCREVTAWLDADVLVTDPPYGVEYRSGWVREDRTIAGDHNTEIRDEALALWGDKPALVFGAWNITRPHSIRHRLVAAKAQERRSVGVEVEERYCRLIASRLAQDVLDFGGAA